MPSWHIPLLLLMTLGSVAAAPASQPVDDGPFQFNETPLMKAAPRAVFVAFMGNYRTPAGSGEWAAWNHEGEHRQRHDPDKIDPATGRRDIASCFYPAIGPYDMSDPDVVDYHCQLLKTAGVDGISFNLYFNERDPWRQKSMRLYVDAMRRYGLKGVVRFEDKFYRNVYPTEAEALRATYADMDAWLSLMDPVQYRVDGRPVFMLFTFVMTPQQLGAWKDKFPPQRRPLIVTFGAKPKYKDVVDGRFGWTGNQPDNLKDRAPYVLWVTPELMRRNELHDRQRAAQLLDSGQICFYMGGVSPGFDDIGCWGWGNGPRKVERDDGRTYQYRWEQMLRTNLSTVLIPTWNDFAEGTTIEPTVEYGDRYLSMTRDYVARFKHVDPPAGDLLTPLWIYKIRKRTTDAAVLAEMSSAGDMIAAGDFAAATAIVAPTAKRLDVNRVDIWDAAATRR